MNTKIIIALIVILVGAAGVVVFMNNQNSSDTNNPTDSLQNQQTQQQDPTEAVATVDGEEVTRAEMQTQLQSLSQSPQAQEASQEELQEMAIEQVVNSKLLIIAAKDEEITAEESEVENQMNTVMGQFENEEMANQQLQQAGMTRESLREDIRDQIIANNYIDQIAQENDVEVSDEDVEAFYEQQVGSQEGAPSLEEVRPQIEDQLIQQEVQPFISAIIEEYRQSADIQILI